MGACLDPTWVPLLQSVSLLHEWCVWRQGKICDHRQSCSQAAQYQCQKLPLMHRLQSLPRCM